MKFYVPAEKFEKHIKESAVWKLGNVGRKNAVVNGSGGGLLEQDGSGDGEGSSEEGGELVNGGGGQDDNEEEEDDEDNDYDGPEKVLLRTRYLTDPGSRDTDELRAWASSAPEMKDVS